jgi:leucyl aminopeptidase
MHLKKSLLALGLALSSSSFIANAETIQFENKITKDTDTLVVFYHLDKASSDFKKYDKKSQGQLKRSIKANEFSGKYGQMLELTAPHNIDANRIVIVGLGEKKELNKAKVAKLGGNLSGKLEQKFIEKITVKSDGISIKLGDFSALLAQGINLRSYRFENYHNEKRSEKSYFFDVDNAKSSKKAYKTLANIEQGVVLARDLISETATEMTPVDFANAAKELASLGVEVKILKPAELKELGMGALEAVGRGSNEGARLVVAHYKGNSDAPIALVGKGITFDSGGYSIKTGASIARMKSDMAGAAAVLGTIKSLALNKVDANVVAVMGMAANMVSESSVAPGDVVRTAEGLTVEIVNTDAEGRLVLSDAMWYARKFFEPSVMVDVATLTGSKIRAVGNDYAAVFSEDDQLVADLTYSGKQVNENLWRLPLGYKDMLKTDIADLKNTGSGGPGATTAASFLQYFAGDVKWAHIDIAGNALSSKAKGEISTGGTGFGVRLLSDWIMNKK